MNERIKEIRKKAEKFVLDIPAALEPSEFDEIFKEKFAELIIEECAVKVSQMVVRDKGHIPQDPHSKGWNEAVEYAGKELKRNFGVE